MKGNDVDVSEDSVVFDFATNDGRQGCGFFLCENGILMVDVEGKLDKSLADCRKSTGSFQKQNAPHPTRLGGHGRCARLAVGFSVAILLRRVAETPQCCECLPTSC